MKHIKNGRLKNTMTYYICDAESKDECIFYCIVKVGSRFEKDSEAGISHFIEHMCLEFTKDSAFKNKASGYTNYEATLYQFCCKNNEESVKETLQVINKIITGEILNIKQIENVRNDVITEWFFQKTSEEYQERNDIYNELLPQELFKQMPIGQIERIKMFNFNELYSFHRKYYVPENIAIVCEGDFEHIDLTSILECELGGLHNNAGLVLNTTIFDLHDLTHRMIIKQDTLKLRIFILLQQRTNLSACFKNELVKVAGLSLLEKAVMKVITGLGIQMNEAVLYENKLTTELELVTIEFEYSDIIGSELTSLIQKTINKDWENELKTVSMEYLRKEVLRILKFSKNQTELSKKCIDNFIYLIPICLENMEDLVDQLAQKDEVLEFIHEVAY